MALGQGRDRTYLVGCSQPERVDDAIAALDVQLTEDDIAHIEEPYTAQS